jgi:hypothetical protein
MIFIKAVSWDGWQRTRRPFPQLEEPIAELRGRRGAGQSQPRFVNECGGLRGLAHRLLQHFLSGQAAEFAVDLGEQTPRRP